MWHNQWCCWAYFTWIFCNTVMMLYYGIVLRRISTIHTHNCYDEYNKRVIIFRSAEYCLLTVLLSCSFVGVVPLVTAMVTVLPSVHITTAPCLLFGHLVQFRFFYTFVCFIFTVYLLPLRPSVIVITAWTTIRFIFTYVTLWLSVNVPVAVIFCDFSGFVFRYGTTIVESVVVQINVWV